MEAQDSLTVFCLVLLLTASDVVARTAFESPAGLSGGGEEYTREFGNGYENFLPKEPDGDYQIRLKKFHFKTTNPECMLGTANNYLPWIFPNGTLTVRNRTIALDMSNLKLIDDAMSSLVASLDVLNVLSEVRYLSMAYNKMCNFPVASLEKFPNVEYLSLMKNPFKEFTPHLESEPRLPKLTSLRALDMRYCRLQTLPADFFHNVTNIQYLFLSHNHITKLPEPIFYQLDRLIHLDLSHMDISMLEDEGRLENPFMRLIAGMDMDANVFEPLQRLKFLDLSYSKLELRAFFALSSLGTQLQYVSYCYTDLPALIDYLFRMKSIKMLDISGNVGCARDLDVTSFYLLRDSLEVLFFKDASIHQLNWLTGMWKLQVINLRGNYLSSLENAPFSKLTSLRVFDVGRNFIQSWNHRIFQNNTKLELLNLRNNNLLLVTNAMMNDFEERKYLAIGSNQLQCSCNFVYLLHEALDNVTNIAGEEGGNSSEIGSWKLYSASVNHLTLYDYNEEDYLCMNFTSKKKVNALEMPGCGKEYESSYLNVSEDLSPDMIDQVVQEYIIIYVVSSVLVVLVLLVVFLVYWNWFYIKYFFVLVKNAAILSFFNEDKIYLDKSELIESASYHYDVFVSYSDNDRNWVLDEMLPNLEQGDLINVCLHERDFEVGYGILENIISCMDRSRCLMLIVSESFLLSRWCQFEMHLAQHRLLETRRDELILVLLEDIPRRKCPKTLSFLMKTKTYIKWPKQKQKPQERELFWKRLRKALIMTKC